MNIEEVRKVADKQFEELVSALEKGQSEGLKAYLGAMSKLYKYSFRNANLIFSQRPGATNVAGFMAWKSQGRFVKKGEKGIAIIVPHVIQSGESGLEKSSEVRGFRAKFVFDVSQTEGAAIPEIAKASGDPGTYLIALREYVAFKGIKLEVKPALGGADGSSSGGVITLREGLNPAEEFSVLVHELAHELLHQGPARATRQVMETEAEAVSSVVSGAIGLSSHGAAADYIQLYSGCAETLKASLEAIQVTAAGILEALLPSS